ncbi:MAG: RpiB/LacA/LacB family sugar-phosphate isomerase [Acidobacteria bacterium]|nr:RpiB/LacA/LacB family sugar-phosphate isomerase [Acidobacteriota bacterium]
MKRFSLITEIEARVLEYGSTVELEPGGQVTPLAADTLRERRVTVRPALGLTDADIAALAPPATIRTVALATDHSGLALKKRLAAHLRAKALAVIDLGTDTPDPVDYPDIAARVAQAVARGDAEAGIVIDGAGIGSAIVANKVRGVRAVMALTPTIARYGREHNGANVVTLGATLLSIDEALAVVDMFLATPMTEARYIRRLAKVRALETP